MRDEYFVNFKGDCCTRTPGQHHSIASENRYGAYRLIGRPLQALIGAVHATKHEKSTGYADMESIRLWHSRLRHAHFESVKKLARLHAVTGLKSGGVMQNLERETVKVASPGSRQDVVQYWALLRGWNERKIIGYEN